MTHEFEFPALYESADSASRAAQQWFWWTIIAEYILLFFVAVLSATRSLSGISPLALTCLLIVLGALFVFKVVKKLDQEWYRCRALAESVKTSSWRFVMRAHPFQDDTSIEIPKGNFRNFLREILKANQHLAENLIGTDRNQITGSMLEVRSLSLEDRISYYVSYRIDNQRRWYTKKSRYNKKAFNRWVAITVLFYMLAGVAVNSDRIGLDFAGFAFDPLIVLVTSAIGWLQMKRHGELMASYNLTAHEIGIIRGNSESIKTEEQLSDFVNEAELAFSREHTQWVARREAN